MEQNYKENSYIFSPLSISAGILVLAFVISTYLFFIKDKKTVSNTSVNTEKISLDDQLRGLYDRSKINVPPVKSSIDVSSKNLPIEFITLFGTDVSYQNVKSIVYDNGSLGFEVEFASMNNVVKTYFTLRNNLIDEGWSVIYGSRYEESGIFNIENKDYTVSIVLVKLEESKTSVRASIINKKI